MIETCRFGNARFGKAGYVDGEGRATEQTCVIARIVWSAPGRPHSQIRIPSFAPNEGARNAGVRTTPQLCARCFVESVQT